MILDRDKGIQARNDGQARDFHSDARAAGYLDFNWERVCGEASHVSGSDAPNWGG